MPVLRIIVLDPPAEYSEHSDIRLTLQTKKSHEEPVEKSSGSLVFEVPYDLKPDRAGIEQPSGPRIFFHSDGKRFVYLQWEGTREGTRERFRRIKLYFEDMPPNSAEVTIPGRDAKGGPSCARVKPL